MINILDCTLRDGGYINDFNFSYGAIKKIIQRLSDSKIEIIECGFMKNSADDPDKSLYGNVQSIKKLSRQNPMQCLWQ